MILFPVLAALSASFGWASGSVLAHDPAKRLGAFEFTRIQLVACSVILAVICSALGLWGSIDLSHWPAFAISILFGILLGNLAMIEALRRGGPRVLELLLTMKAPIVALMAYFWLGEVLSLWDCIGAGVTLAGIALAIMSSGGSRGSVVDGGGLIAVILLSLTAAILQGLGFLIVKPSLLEGAAPLAVSAVRLLGAGLLISVIALWPSPALQPKERPTPTLVGATILPGFIGYGVSSSLLLLAMAHMEAGIAVTLGSLSPVMVLPILWFKTGHRPDKLAWIGAMLAVLGTALIAL
ncbi:DMT family transporter [Tropicibacter sp. R15_0]|uniref:DMT family transporter n=1 Tax=Tropicibacter sp. R15_0 TaxID=2821101 RepID=UPI001ADD5E4C|nr:DMT family transporter [Tropicibacter sp. R15_0]MBO9466805.1 DMT family transporter [Tropicibacter sp. R15_0]